MHEDGLLVEDAQFLRQFLVSDLYAPIGHKPGHARQAPSPAPDAAAASQTTQTNSVPTLVPPAQPVQPAAQLAANPLPPAPTPVKTPSPAPVVVPVAALPQSQIPSYGENAARMLVLVIEPNHDFLASADLELLLKILSSIKRTATDIALVNLGRVGMLPWAALNKQFGPVQVLTFGMPKTGYPALALSQRYAVTSMGAFKTLHADPISAMQGNDTLKRALWNGLKGL